MIRFRWVGPLSKMEEPVDKLLLIIVVHNMLMLDRYLRLVQ